MIVGPSDHWGHCIGGHILTHVVKLYMGDHRQLFFSLTASILIPVINLSTDLLVRELPAFLVRSFQCCSSQNLSNCITMSWPLSFVALVSSREVRPFFTRSCRQYGWSTHFLNLGYCLCSGPTSGLYVCAIQGTVGSTAASLSFTTSVSYSHSWCRHLCFGVVCFPRGNLSS